MLADILPQMVTLSVWAGKTNRPNSMGIELNLGKLSKPLYGLTPFMTRSLSPPRSTKSHKYLPSRSSNRREVWNSKHLALIAMELAK